MTDPYSNLGLLVVVFICYWIIVLMGELVYRYIKLRKEIE